MQGEKVDPDSRGDLHESFDVGGEEKAFVEGKEAVNQWPQEEAVPGFKAAIQTTWSVATG